MADGFGPSIVFAAADTGTTSNQVAEINVVRAGSDTAFNLELQTADATRLRDEIKNLESTIEKCEDDKNTKDSQIRTLRDEIAHQEDMIVKLGEAICRKNVFEACSIFCFPFRQGEEGHR